MSEDVRVRCAAMTKSGRPCRNYALDDGQYCHTHRHLAEKTAVADTETNKELDRLIGELDELVAELKSSVPESSPAAYTPAHMLNLLRENIRKMPPDLSLGILENFEGMTVEDLKDIDTWKGLAYMFSYSARFQAGQAKDKMNETLPEPLKPDTLMNYVRKNVERFAPDVAKDILTNFEGATKEDFLDPDTWKGVWYMLDYSMRFQLDQWKNKLSGESAED